MDIKIPHWNEYMINALKMKKGRCLDIGVGNGLDKDLIENLDYQWIGIDAKFNKNLITQCDAHHLPFKSNKFNSVCSIACLEHLSNPFFAIKEMNRVLIKNGLLLLTVALLEPFHESYYHFTEWGLKYVLEINDFKVLKIKPGWHVLDMVNKHFVPIKFLRKLLSKLIKIFKKYHAIKYSSIQRKSGLNISSDDVLKKYAGSLICIAQKIK